MPPASDVCSGRAFGVILNGPSLTEGYPATNPTIRRLVFTGSKLTDIYTYIADLHEAESSGSLRWVLEYDFRKQFQMSDLSPASFEVLHAQFAQPVNQLWHDYRGRGDGTLFVGRYLTRNSTTSPPKSCNATGGRWSCQAAAVCQLNATEWNC